MLSSFIRTGLSLVVASCVVVGCTQEKSGYEKAQLTSKRLVDTKAELATARAEVVNSTAALDALVNNPQADLRPQYEKFSKAVDKLETRRARTRDRAADMRQNRDAYIAKWKSEADALTDPKLRERAYARMGEARASFNTLTAKADVARDDFAPFMTNMQDLKRYLGADLTRGGIESVSDLIKSTRASEKKLLASIDDVSAELDRIAVDMSPVAK